MKKTLIAAILVALAAAASAQTLDPLKEYRYFGPPVRLKDGSIRRRADVLRAFQKAHPCPSTGLTAGACPGWAIDHVIPLACGGFDAVWNLQWFPNDLKSTNAAHAKDRFERKIYEATPPIEDTAACQPFQLVP